MSVGVGASAPAPSAEGGTWRWNSATPYLLGSIVMVMLLIAVAFLMLLCSVRKERRRSADKSVRGEVMSGPPAPLQEFVVIMAGEDKPTYLAMPTVLPSASEAGGDHRSVVATADPSSELIA